MQDQVHEAASSVSVMATTKGVALGSATVGVGEVAKQSMGGWMLTYYIPIVDVNTVQLIQLGGGILVAIQIIKFAREEWNRCFGKSKQQSAPDMAMSVNGGQDKPKPR